jgi:F0F1-type ATP synthase assembly protein I
MRNLTMWQAVAYGTELAVAFAAAVVVGLLIGHWADERLGNGVPILTIVGSLIGFAAGVFSTVRIAQFVTRPK